MPMVTHHSSEPEFNIQAVLLMLLTSSQGAPTFKKTAKGAVRTNGNQENFQKAGVVKRGKRS